LGIKVDFGAKSFLFCFGEVVIEGLDGLCERLVEYKGFGVVFSKWRVVITIGDDILFDTCIRVNVHVLVCYVVFS